MPEAKAHAQAGDALEDAAVALKRTIGVARRALQSVRQAQMNLIGVEVETVNTQPEEGMVDGINSGSE